MSSNELRPLMELEVGLCLLRDTVHRFNNVGGVSVEGEEEWLTSLQERTFNKMTHCPFTFRVHINGVDGEKGL